MIDGELVELARNGGRRACDQLVERHQTAGFPAALAALRVPEDAEDVAHDAFMRALGGLRGSPAAPDAGSTRAEQLPRLPGSTGAKMRLVAAQAADPVSDRRVSVEATATVLK